MYIQFLRTIFEHYLIFVAVIRLSVFFSIPIVQIEIINT